jgi:hypothetical protein
MYKINKGFALLLLFLSLYVSGIAINLNQAFSTKIHLKNFEFVQEKKSGETQIPKQIIDLVDEREIDEDEQVKFNLSYASQNLSFLIVYFSAIAANKSPLPFHFKDNFSIKESRIVLFHSWKYLIF